MGIPLSKFREWDAEDVDWLIAFRSFRDTLGSHGHPMDEATSQEANPNNPQGSYQYVSPPPLTDWAQKSREDAQDAYRKSMGDDVNMNGLIFPVERKERDGSTVDPYSFEGR
jgi:hypothetical protein